MTPLEAAFAAVGFTPDSDVYFDYDFAGNATTNGDDAGSCPASCGTTCFTAAAYSNLDNDAGLAIMAYFQPSELTGDICTTALLGRTPPPGSGGADILREVVRIPVGAADDF